MISEDELSLITESDLDQQETIYDSENIKNIKDPTERLKQGLKAHQYKYPSTSSIFKVKEDILDYF